MFQLFLPVKTVTLIEGLNKYVYFAKLVKHRDNFTLTYSLKQKKMF
jgi:hypothetical protein